MKYILSLTVTVAAALTTYGQATAAPPTPCTTKVAPVIRGVKLGMTIDDVLAMFPGSRENEYVKGSLSARNTSVDFGVTSFWVAPSQYPATDRFSGVGQINFTFVDGRLTQYGISYDRPPWLRVDDFINKLAAAFKLPTAENWSTHAPYRTLSCDGFSLRASIGNGGGSVAVMTGDDPNKIQRDRRAASEEKQRQEFKP